MIDGYGNKLQETDNKNNPENPNAIILRNQNPTAIKKDNKEYKPIGSYKPTGKLIYNNDLIKKLEDKFQ